MNETVRRGLVERAYLDLRTEFKRDGDRAGVEALDQVMARRRRAWKRKDLKA